MVLPWHEEAFRRLLASRARWPHALLVRGEEGIGKLAFAEALASALLCETPAAEGTACGTCRACAWVEQGTHPDLLRVEPEGEGGGEEEGERRGERPIGVDQVRLVSEFIQLSSHRGRAKVVLVHPAEALNVNAANALLKSLEEPPRGTFFLLVSHRWRRLPATVRSRCQQVALAAPGAEAARAWLEKRGLANAALGLAQAGGAPLRALRFDEEFWRNREAFNRALARPSFDPLSAAEELRECSPAFALGWFQRWSFDIALYRSAGRVRYNPDLVEPIAATAARVGLRQMLRFHREMVGLQRIVAHPLNPRLFLEALLLDYAALIRGAREPVL
jgi:DNA polymerase-3 subunit delta'